MIIVKNSDGPPFACQDEVRKTISIQVAPESAANHADFFQGFAVHLVEGEGAITRAINTRTCRFRIPARLYSSTDEQVQIAVSVQVAKRERACAGVSARNDISGHPRAEVVFLHRSGGRLTVFIGS